MTNTNCDLVSKEALIEIQHIIEQEEHITYPDNSFNVVYHEDSHIEMYNTGIYYNLIILWNKQDNNLYGMLWSGYSSSSRYLGKAEYPKQFIFSHINLSIYNKNLNKDFAPNGIEEYFHHKMFE